MGRLLFLPVVLATYSFCVTLGAEAKAEATAGAWLIRLAPGSAGRAARHRLRSDPRVKSLAFGAAAAAAAEAEAAPSSDPTGNEEEEAAAAAATVFVARLGAHEAAALRALPGVVDVEADAPVGLAACDGFDAAFNATAAAEVAAGGGNWGTERVAGTNGSGIDERRGEGVEVFVVDTGVRCTHVELAGHCDAGFSAFGYEADGGGDPVGHGTHIAGVVAGASRGMAPRARVVSVRVLDHNGKGSKSSILEGLSFVSREARQRGLRAAVVNLSFVTQKSPTLQAALEALSCDGHLIVLAAGNDRLDACQANAWGGPRSKDFVVTVSASDRSNTLASFSNYGSCVDLSAPGVDIASAYFRSDSDWITASGTSQAAPFVCGAAALYLARYPEADGRSAKAWLLRTAREAVGIPLNLRHDTTAKMLSLSCPFAPEVTNSSGACVRTVKGASTVEGWHLAVAAGVAAALACSVAAGLVYCRLFGAGARAVVSPESVPSGSSNGDSTPPSSPQIAVGTYAV